jgi:hypothetical protein
MHAGWSPLHIAHADAWSMCNVLHPLRTDRCRASGTSNSLRLLRFGLRPNTIVGPSGLAATASALPPARYARSNWLRLRRNVRPSAGTKCGCACGAITSSASQLPNTTSLATLASARRTPKSGAASAEKPAWLGGLHRPPILSRYPQSKIGRPSAEIPRFDFADPP